MMELMRIPPEFGQHRYTKKGRLHKNRGYIAKSSELWGDGTRFVQ